MSLKMSQLVSRFCRFLCRTFPSRARTIPQQRNPSVPLLTQFAVLRSTFGVAIYLQHFETPNSESFHRHAWRYMRSWVLSGWFREHRWNWLKSHPESITHRAGESYTMAKHDVHRVDYWSPDCWTLFLMVKPDDDWGYYDLQRDGNQLALANYRPWRDEIVKRVPSLDTGKITP